MRVEFREADGSGRRRRPWMEAVGIEEEDEAEMQPRIRESKVSSSSVIVMVWCVDKNEECEMRMAKQRACPLMIRLQCHFSLACWRDNPGRRSKPPKPPPARQSHFFDFAQQTAAEFANVVPTDTLCCGSCS